MKYPEKLNVGDTIGVTALSAGIVEKDDIIKLNNVKVNLEKLGYKYIETKNVRTDENGRSSPAKMRAEEFMELWKNKGVKTIISARGGDFLIEVLEHLDFEKIKQIEPKWFQGYSDNTNIGFLLTTICDIATIYGSTIKSFGTRNMQRSQLDSIKLMNKQEILQESFPMYESNWLEKIIKGEKIEEKDPLAEDELVNKVEWKNLNNEKQISMSGRIIGGCFDVIINLIGTRYDNVKKFIEKYKNDGIIWFLEVFDQSTVEVYCHLWQMKNAGYFENCKGVIFGRSLMLEISNNMDMKETLKGIFNDMQIPVIFDADIGHLGPVINIVNGSIVNIKSENGKGSIKTHFK